MPAHRFSLAAAAFALATGCAPFGNFPEQSNTTLPGGALWDPNSLVATTDGLYVMLPHSGGAVVLSAKDGSSKSVDIGEGRITRFEPAPDGKTVVAFVERYTCDGDEVPVDECTGENRLETTSELAILADGKVTDTVPLDGAYNALAFSDDGKYAVAYLDFARLDLADSGVLNLTSVAVVDLAKGDVSPVTVGFAADRVLFTYDSSGAADRAVVLSSGEVALVDIGANPPSREVTFPLRLDPDQTVIPRDVTLTPDGNYALITVEGSSDLYVLDLVTYSINIVELAGAPSAMVLDAATDRTVFVYNTKTQAQVLDHAQFETSTYTLDEAMTQIIDLDGSALLYDTSSNHDAYRMDVATGDLVEYRLQNPAVEMHVAPTGEFAVALTRAENGFNGGVEGVYDQYPGLEILDLRSDDTTPFKLEGQGIGLAFSAKQTSLRALVLQSEVQYLLDVDLYTGKFEEIDLDEPPISIGSMPDGTYFVANDDPLGRVVFFDAAGENQVIAGGFATYGLYDPIETVAPAGGGKE